MVAASGSIPSCDGLFVTDLGDIYNAISIHKNVVNHQCGELFFFLENRKKIDRRNWSARPALDGVRRA